ncbi:sugar ABC transporter substrate-binding protein [uncultured Serinicoccus sp.]|uniref:ABC transporter substrate-binding protein n=1 Tax=uncultured Serinicoccus sp. TaxID=735514 RepID=UPI002615492A|nr:sugar ABC transporter substrate-binding protein [uncultured Serinicoccus sp.]
MRPEPSAPASRRPSPVRAGRAGALVGALSLLALAGCSAEEDTGPDTLTIAVVDNGDLEVLQELSPAFLEEHPGVEIEWVRQGENELRETVSTDVGTGAGRFDVASVGTYEAQVWAGQELLTPLTDMPDGFDPEAFVPEVRDALSADGTMQAAPFYGESSVTMYRTDLLEEVGVEMPDEPTWEDVLAAATAVDEQTDAAGACIRGKAGWGENGAVLTAMAHSYGARWFDEDWRAQLDSEQWRSAAETYLALAALAPDGVAEAGYSENLALFQEGECGVWVDATSAASFVTDPEVSTVAEDVGFAMAPGTPEGRASNWLWSWALAIPASSDNSELAREFVTWATSSEYAGLVAEDRGWAAVPPGSRVDLYDNPDYLEAAEPFAELTLESIRTSDIAEPSSEPVPYVGMQYVDVPAFQSLGNAVGQQLTQAITGDLDLDEALERSQWVADQTIEQTRLLADQEDAEADSESTED